MMRPQVKYLAECQEHIPIIAAWIHKQWGYLHPKRTLKEVENDVRQGTNYDRIPLTKVLLIKGQPVACAELIPCDMPSHKHLTPWLASVYTKDAFRKRGLGALMVAEILSEARRLNFEKIHLFTPDKELWYQSMGFRTIERPIYKGQQVTLMALEIKISS